MSNIFQPMPSKSTTIAATGTTASATVPAEAPSLRIFNLGPSTIFIRWGVGTQTSVTTDMAIPAGVVEMFHKGRADTVAAICGAGGTSTVYLTPGAGE
jgi:hypothetical protein